METTIKISGMTCGHCEGKVSAELGKIAGVSEVKAIAAEGVAIVTSLETLNSEEVSRAVVTAGYRIVL